jgi:hypothetical protein
VAPQWGQRCELPNNGKIRLEKETMNKNPTNSKITPSDLKDEAARLIATDQMPNLERFLGAVAVVRQKYRPQILEGRRQTRIHLVKSLEPR